MCNTFKMFKASEALSIYKQRFNSDNYSLVINDFIKSVEYYFSNEIKNRANAGYNYLYFNSSSKHNGYIHIKDMVRDISDCPISYDVQQKILSTEEGKLKYVKDGKALTFISYSYILTKEEIHGAIIDTLTSHGYIIEGLKNWFIVDDTCIKWDVTNDK